MFVVCVVTVVVGWFVVCFGWFAAGVVARVYVVAGGSWVCVVAVVAGVDDVVLVVDVAVGVGVWRGCCCCILIFRCCWCVCWCCCGCCCYCDVCC